MVMPATPADAANRLMASPRTVLEPAVMLSPDAPDPALVPFSSMMGALDQPACVCASMTTGSAIAGNADVGAIVATPPPNMLA